MERHYATALVMHEACGRHDTGWAHPEHQGRLPAILHAIYAATPELLDHVLQHEPEPATEADAARVHTRHHLERLRRAAEIATETNRIVGLDSETLVSPATWDAVFASAGCAISACRLLLDGSVNSAFALCRPPGHHATADTAMGFCHLNNVAIGARWLQSRGVERVLILDWDVHHGNGTQDIFYADGSVYYLSLHQSPLYPGTGHPDEHGEREGTGTTLNVPILAGTDGIAYLRTLEAALTRATRDFTPDFVLVSAGFDCLRGDPLGGLHLEPADLHAATSIVLGLGRPAVFLLEGGYNPPRVGAGVVEVLRALAEDADSPPRR